MEATFDLQVVISADVVKRLALWGMAHVRRPQVSLVVTPWTTVNLRAGSPSAVNAAEGNKLR